MDLVTESAETPPVVFGPAPCRQPVALKEKLGSSDQESLAAVGSLLGRAPGSLGTSKYPWKGTVERNMIREADVV